jgi:hypothetical protein
MSSDRKVSISFVACINPSIDSSVIDSNSSVETAPGSIHENCEYALIFQRLQDLSTNY